MNEEVKDGGSGDWEAVALQALSDKGRLEEKLRLLTYQYGWQGSQLGEAKAALRQIASELDDALDVAQALSIRAS